MSKFSELAGLETTTHGVAHGTALYNASAAKGASSKFGVQYSFIP